MCVFSIVLDSVDLQQLLIWRTLVYNTCALSLDVHSDADEDTTTFNEIAVMAGTILLACIAQAPHRGGTQYVGPMAVMNVSVFGIPIQRPPRLSLPALRGPVWNISSLQDSLQR